LLTDATGIPLAVRVTGGNRNDVTELLPLVEQVHPCVAGPGGRGGALSGWSLTAVTIRPRTARPFESWVFGR
jgi:hypothetical protein